MRRIACLMVLLVLAGCGGDKPTATLSVVCPGGSQLNGARSIDIASDAQSGRPQLLFPDPVNPGKVGAITVQPGDHCTITPATSSK